MNFFFYIDSCRETGAFVGYSNIVKIFAHLLSVKISQICLIQSIWYQIFNLHFDHLFFRSRFYVSVWSTTIRSSFIHRILQHKWSLYSGHMFSKCSGKLIYVLQILLTWLLILLFPVKWFCFGPNQSPHITDFISVESVVNSTINK